MSDRQIQPLRTREREIAVVRPPRARGLITQVSTALLQPRYFFRTVPLLVDSRQWITVALLILALVGWSAVRQESFSSSTPIADTFDPGLSGDVLLPGDPGLSGIPGDIITNPPIPSSINETPDITESLITALIAASHILLGWFILTVLLCEVSLFNSAMPNLNLNLQIAIWTTVPIGLMAGIQLIYYAAGGKPGQIGITGLLPLWEDYGQFSGFARSALLSLSSRITIFWFWSLFLLYIGARHTLRGKWWAALLVVIAWALLLIVLPVVSGSISAPDLAITHHDILPSMSMFLQNHPIFG